MMVCVLTFCVAATQTEYKDSASYIDAYRTVAAGGIQGLKDYALSSLDAAKDSVYEAVQKEVVESQHSSVTALSVGQLRPNLGILCEFSTGIASASGSSKAV